MLTRRYHGVMKLEHAAAYLVRQHPGAREPIPAGKQDSAVRLAVEILQSLRKVVTWCDYATL